MTSILDNHRRRFKRAMVIGWLVIGLSFLLLIIAEEFGLAERLGVWVIVTWFALFCYGAYVTLSIRCPRCNAWLLGPFGYYVPDWWNFFRDPVQCHRCGLNLSEQRRDVGLRVP
jgi:hypothetical protein